MADLKTRLKILFGIYKLPDNLPELLEIKKSYDELYEKYKESEQERRDAWMNYCDWCELVVDRYRCQTDALIEANTSLTQIVRNLCEAFSKITADDSLEDE